MNIKIEHEASDVAISHDFDHLFSRSNLWIALTTPMAENMDFQGQILKYSCISGMGGPYAILKWASGSVRIDAKFVNI